MEAEDIAPTPETLTIELEELATRSVWKAMLGLLSSQTQMWHFVGVVRDRPVYESPTFAAPYSWGTLPLGKTLLPREEWAPGMEQALTELRDMIRNDGWVQSGHGEHPWEDVYHRPVTIGSEASASSP